MARKITRQSLPETRQLTQVPTDDPWSVRLALRGDARAIANIHCVAAIAAYVDIFPRDASKPTPDSLEPSWLQLIDDPDVEVFVATVGDVLVGSVVLEPDEEVPAQLLLKRLYVDPARWRQGVGSTLHDHVLAQARRREAGSLNLWVLERNERARRMYERRGWQLVPGRTLPNDPPSVVDVLYERLLP